MLMSTQGLAGIPGVSRMGRPGELTVHRYASPLNCGTHGTSVTDNGSGPKGMSPRPNGFTAPDNFQITLSEPPMPLALRVTPSVAPCRTFVASYVTALVVVAVHCTA